MVQDEIPFRLLRRGQASVENVCTFLHEHLESSTEVAESRESHHFHLVDDGVRAQDVEFPLNVTKRDETDSPLTMLIAEFETDNYFIFF